jgi:HEAT repeat protein
LAPRALGKIGPDAKTAVPALQQFLNENPDTSPWAAEALWRIDPAQATVANESLGKAFIHTNRFTRIKAARVHWKINQKPDVVSPILIELMKDSQNLWVIDTMRALQDVTPSATNALEVLKERLNDGESSVRSVAAEVITSIERASAKATDASQKQSK